MWMINGAFEATRLVTIQATYETRLSADQIKLPSDNNFGITAASSETPDSFEVFKFVVKTTTSYAREEPRKQKVIPPVEKAEQVIPEASSEQIKDSDASSIKSQEAQFADLHNRLQLMSHSMDNLFREVTRSSSLSQVRQSELQSTLLTKDHMKILEDRFQNIENALAQLRKDVNSKDYTGHFNDIHSSLKTRHDNLLASLPETMGHGKSSRIPISLQLDMRVQADSKWDSDFQPLTSHWLLGRSSDRISSAPGWSVCDLQAATS